LTGRLVLTSWLDENNNSIDLSSQKPGIYFINLRGKNVYNFKLVKE